MKVLQADMAAGPVRQPAGQWTGNPSMKLRATGTNCCPRMMSTIQASNVGDTGPEKENRKEMNYRI